MRRNAAWLLRTPLCNAVPSLLLGTLLVSACGSQAGEGYMGEPLLSMRGQATVSTPTGGEPIVPALCFADQPSFIRSLGMKSLALDHLPPEIEQDLRSDQRIGSEPPWPHDYDHLVHIVDVESTGQFPAEFAVDVYAPPPAGALSDEQFGESRIAAGFVCAVKRDHRAKTHTVQYVERYRCNDEDTAQPTDCYIRTLWIVAGTDRYYSERYACAVGVSSYKDCTRTSNQGDASLKLETWAEDVLGAAYTPSITYLESPAAPGTMAAWSLGAAQGGLAAGYHLFGDTQSVLPAWFECMPEPEAVIAELPAEFRNDAQLTAVIRSEPLESYALTWQQAWAQFQADSKAERKKCPNRPGPPPADGGALSIEISPKPPTSFGPPPAE